MQGRGDSVKSDEVIAYAEVLNILISKYGPYYLQGCFRFYLSGENKYRDGLKGGPQVL